MTLSGTDEEMVFIYHSLIDLINRYKAFEMDIMRGMKLSLADMPASIFTANSGDSSVTIDITSVCHVSLYNNPIT